jgi:uncharacterized PurR-regulated membrane protein YhhQ (DUF165 family)
MSITNEARIMIGILMITLPAVEFGGYFLLSQLGRKDSVIRTDLQGSYYRAMHAHAGVLVLLAIIAQLMIDVAAFDALLSWAVRIGFAAAPILIPLGFAISALTTESTDPKRARPLIYVGAILLAISLVVLALGLLFGGNG